MPGAKPKPKFNPGDRVVFTGRGSAGVGEVVKCANLTARWKPDGQVEQRTHVDNLRLETAADVAEREHADAMLSWIASRPSTKVARARYDSGCRSDTEIAATATARSLAEMRQAAGDLTALGDWFDAKPKGPT